MNNELRAQWERFLNGKWTKDRPSKPGAYRVCDYQGNQQSTPIVALKHESGTILTLQSWGGYWWSEPTPELPPLNA